MLCIGVFFPSQIDCIVVECLVTYFTLTALPDCRVSLSGGIISFVSELSEILWDPSLIMVLTPTQWGAAGHAEIKIRSVENPELTNILPFKSWSRSEKLYLSCILCPLPGKYFSVLISSFIFLIHSPAFVPNPLPTLKNKIKLRVVCHQPPGWSLIRWSIIRAVSHRLI